MPPRSPVPDGVADELRRVVRRWQQLPLDHALGRAAAVRALLDELTDAEGAGRRVPDLGPAVLMDQLAVVVYDACEAGRSDGLDERLVSLRRSIG